MKGREVRSKNKKREREEKGEEREGKDAQIH